MTIQDARPVDAIKKASVNLGSPNYDSSSNQKIKRSQQPSQPSYNNMLNKRKEKARKAMESLRAEKERTIHRHNARFSKGRLDKDVRRGFGKTTGKR